MLPRLFLAGWAVLAQTPTAEIREIADPDDPDLATNATAVSADGKVVVGDATDCTASRGRSRGAPGPEPPGPRRPRLMYNAALSS